MATRFEKMLKARQQDESCKEMDESELLHSIIARYNAYRANAAIKKWQITNDQAQAMGCIICGLYEESSRPQQVGREWLLLLLLQGTFWHSFFGNHLMSSLSLAALLVSWSEATVRCF